MAESIVTLVDPMISPNFVGIRWESERPWLVAFPICHPEAYIHAGGKGEWHCSACNTPIECSGEPGPSSSVMQPLRVPEDDILTWVSCWLGLPRADITVKKL